MRLSDFSFVLFRFLLLPAVICTTLLYLYPALLNCHFPLVKSGQAGSNVAGEEQDAVLAEIAPFRLLALGDPQLEGDTSLPDPHETAFPSLERLLDTIRDGALDTLPSALNEAARGLIKTDIPTLLQGYRKQIDLFGNDLYLAHIYRTVSWWTQPTHTVVLGDLLGSQWIGDDEFDRRSSRFWNFVFRGAQKVPDSVADVRGGVEVLEEDESWKKRIIAVAGNHDIGYAGDIDEHRIERFEDAFGRVNWEVRFRLDNLTMDSIYYSRFGQSTGGAITPELRLIVLNSMNLDDPATNTQLRDASRNFLTHELHQLDPESPKTTAVILLTHIPFHKEFGVCVDGPLFRYFQSEEGGGIREQNHLTDQGSAYILNGLTNPEKFGNAIVLNGHDHEGCDTYHYSTNAPAGIDSVDDGHGAPQLWHAKRFQSAAPELGNESLVGVREITVRSMMGSFGGNAGLLSAWFDPDDGEWRFEYSTCGLGVQHIWWAVHILDLVVLGFGLVGCLARLCEVFSAAPRGQRRSGGKMKEA